MAAAEPLRAYLAIRHQGYVGCWPRCHTQQLLQWAVKHERHPNVPESRADRNDGKMIAAAINADTVWFWRGVPSPLGSGLSFVRRRDRDRQRALLVAHPAVEEFALTLHPEKTRLIESSADQFSGTGGVLPSCHRSVAAVAPATQPENDPKPSNATESPSLSAAVDAVEYGVNRFGCVAHRDAGGVGDVGGKS